MRVIRDMAESDRVLPGEPVVWPTPAAAWSPLVVVIAGPRHRAPRDQRPAGPGLRVVGCGLPVGRDTTLTARFFAQGPAAAGRDPFLDVDIDHELRTATPSQRLDPHHAEPGLLR